MAIAVSFSRTMRARWVLFLDTHSHALHINSIIRLYSRFHGTRINNVRLFRLHFMFYSYFLASFHIHSTQTTHRLHFSAYIQSIIIHFEQKKNESRNPYKININVYELVERNVLTFWLAFNIMICR